METATNPLRDLAEELGYDADAFEGFCENQHFTADEAEEAISAYLDAYVGEFDSEAKFAEELIIETEGDIPTIVLSHINWDDVWTCELRHDYYEINGHFFRNI